MAADKALQYVGPIMDAYNAAEKAGATALGYALECGKQLSAAFKTVEAAKGSGSSGARRTFQKSRKKLKECTADLLTLLR